jgi:hemolysin activation/secretion protein
LLHYSFLPLAVLCLGAGAALADPVPGPSAPAKPQLAIELDEIRVDGNSVLPPEQIEETVYPFLGPGKTATDVEHARAALLRLYQQRGYQTVAVTIPPQRVTQGIVYLKVVEQPLERVRVVGAHYVEPAVLRHQARSLKKGKVINFNALKTDVAALNVLPDRSVTPSLRPGRAPNTVDVDLDVQDSLPLHGTLELDNRRSADTTALRLNGSLSYDNFFQRGDTGTVFFQVAPENTADASVVGGSYLFHIPDSILAVLLSYTNSNSNVSTVGNLNVVGKGQIATLQVQVPLGITDGFIQSFDASIAYKRLDENDIEGASSGSPSAATYPLTYYPVTLAYEGDWIGPNSRTSLNAGATFGLSGLGSQDSQFDNKRKYANQNFADLRISLSRTQDLPHGFQLYANSVAQISADPLVSTEQLDIGGLDSVRGYLESEALGDQGAALQVEARSPSIARYFGKPVDQWRFHLFSDIGNVSIHRALFDQASSYTLSSVGVGTRISLFGYLNATLEDAILLSRGPNSRSGTNRVLFRLYGSF